MPFSLKFNWKVFLYILGIMIMFQAIAFIPSTLVSITNNEENIYAFPLSFSICILVGVLLVLTNRKYPSMLSKKDGRIIVGLIWLLTPFIGALPYIFMPERFSFIDALFESVSGFTTTGSSIVQNLDQTPHSILLWRAITQWIGGLGLTLFVIAFIQNFRNGSNYLFNAEFTSIDKEKVHPHIRSTVLRIFNIYLGLTLFSIIMLSFGDMDFFTIICHSFSAVSTGGFTTVNANIGMFSSYTQYVLLFVMFLSGISYVLIYWLFKGRWRKLIEDQQFRIYFLIILLASIVLGVFFYNQGMCIEETFRKSLFNIVSIVSTTGYQMSDTQQYGIFASALILLLMFIGGCSASSSTGLKIIRVIILLKFVNTSIKKIFHPRAVIPIKYNKVAIASEAVNLVFGFFFLYLLFFIFGAFALTITGNDFIPSIAMSAANISNIGPVASALAPEPYYALNYPSKIVLMFLMMIGRLEIYSFLAMFSRSVWRKI